LSPKKDLDGDYFVLNEALHSYVGRRTGKTYQIGNSIKIIVTNADPIICSIGFAIVKEKKLRTKQKTKLKDESSQKETNKSTIVKNKRKSYKKYLVSKKI
jgi:hypothetical protein